MDPLDFLSWNLGSLKNSELPAGPRADKVGAVARTPIRHNREMPWSLAGVEAGGWDGSEGLAGSFSSCRPQGTYPLGRMLLSESSLHVSVPFYIGRLIVLHPSYLFPTLPPFNCELLQRGGRCASRSRRCLTHFVRIPRVSKWVTLWLTLFTRLNLSSSCQEFSLPISWVTLSLCLDQMVAELRVVNLWADGTPPRKRRMK